MNLFKLSIMAIVLAVLTYAVIDSKRQPPSAKEVPTAIDLSSDSEAEEDRLAAEQGWVKRSQPFAELSLQTLERLHISGPEFETRIHAEGERFLFEGGEAVRKDELAKLLTQLSEISLAGAVAEKASVVEEDFGFQPPQLRIDLSEGQSQHELSFGAEHPITRRRYFTFKASPHIFSVDSFHYDAVLQALEQLPDRSVLSFALAAVSGVHVQPKDGKPYQLVRHDFQAEALGDWLVQAESQEFPAERGFTERKFSSLASLEGQEVFGRSLREPLLRLEFALKEPNNRGRTLEKAAFYEDERRGMFLLENVEEGRIFEVKGGHYKDFLSGPLQFRIRRPFVESAASAKTLEDGAWKESAVEVDQSVREQIAAFEVLSYEAAEESLDAAAPAIAFELEGRPLRMQLGEAIVRGELPPRAAVEEAAPAEGADEAPRYIVVQHGEEFFRALVAAAELRRLFNELP